MIKKLVFSILLFAFASVAGANEIYACSCVPSGAVEEEAKNSFAVFSGQVVGVTKINDAQKIKIKVLKSWKGDLPKTITLTTAANSAMCGYSFKKGRKYLIYAGGENKNNIFVSLCSRTANFAAAGKDLKILEKLKKAEKL